MDYRVLKDFFSRLFFLQDNKKRNVFLARIFLFIWALCVFNFLFSFYHYQTEKTKVIREISYSQMLKEASAGEYSSVSLSHDKIYGVYRDNPNVEFETNSLGSDPIDVFLKNNTQVWYSSGKTSLSSILLNLLLQLFPLVLMLYFAGRSGGTGKIFDLLGSGAKLYDDSDGKVLFADVAGCNEVKSEVIELVDFLKDPKKCSRLGAEMPKGLMLYGPTGTGKTLIARAIAGEAGVPFFYESGSNFVKMVVGAGPERIKSLFEKARKNAPCLVFIDEIEALLRTRSGSGSGSNFGGTSEHENTLNQFLIEVDGFEKNSGVILVGATNRLDMIDPAALRPGRFDRQVYVPLPTLTGRAEILDLYLKKIQVSPSVNSEKLAKLTSGFSGASLKNLCNEAALFATRRHSLSVEFSDFCEARDKILMGLRQNSLIMSTEDRRLTAYHEAGHAIVGYLLDKKNLVERISIIPRGQALGVTMFTPSEEEKGYHYQDLVGRLAVMQGGRAAEILIYGFHNVSSGCSSDLKNCTSLAYQMVSRWGMGRTVGSLSCCPDDRILPNDLAASGRLLEDIQSDVRFLVEDSEIKALNILKDYSWALHEVSRVLLEKDEISGEDLSYILKMDRGVQLSLSFEDME